MNDNKLILTKYRDFNAAFLFKDGDIDELILSRDTEFNVGDIYVGRVSTVKNDLKACFVEFKESVNGYLPFEDIYPECLLNRSYDGRLIQGDLVCVQVVKEPLKTKGATLSMRLTLTGALSVVTLDDPKVHISSKLNKEYKKQADEYFKGKSFGYGFVLRTNAADASFEEIEAEITKNAETFKELVSIMKFRSAFTCLYKAESSFVQRIRSIKSDRYDEAVTDNTKLLEELKGLKNLRLYDDQRLPLKAVYSFDKAYSLATEKKVDIKYGGYLIIEPTEAMTVIDVNSGKFDKKMAKEDAVEKINLEAAREIARQLRLRNISGIIIVDFINQNKDKNYEQLASTIRHELSKDSLKASLIDFTSLGLAEITREKRHSSIYDIAKYSKA
ncbi:MAG: ribonuclease E/G [Lachnospiraceae bacterium]|nr:ribonuclease E/G [Lachnospiraceae bacterium]